MTRLLRLLLPLSCVILLLVAACSDSTYSSPVPEPAYLRYSCNIETINAIAGQTSGQAQLMSPGGYVCIYDPKILTASDAIGTAGLLLLQSTSDQGRFYAFDLMCPACYHTGYRISRLTMSSSGLAAECTACSSQFGAVMWGSPAPTAGPANQEGVILRQYRATLLPDGYTLVVTK